MEILFLKCIELLLSWQKKKSKSSALKKKKNMSNCYTRGQRVLIHLLHQKKKEREMTAAVGHLGARG